MSPEAWRKVKALFHDALECAPGERAAFLTRHCNGNIAVRAEVESLLAAHEAAVSVVDTPALRTREGTGSSGGQWTAESAAEPVVQRIGAYQVTGVIATGGMGTVYAAVRADDAFNKRVAIKLIRTGADRVDPVFRQELIRRFRLERQALANLDHPNIAKMLDGGTTDDGTPYLVMDHIDGVPIDRYFDTHRYRTVDRLRVFLSVCRAVQHAHQNFIVHRDLKPSNILVTNDGVPKLLDFGIAKLLEGPGGGGRAMQGGAPSQLMDLTRSGPRLMTPEFASPELIRGEPVTAASDVYSLGVILYQLLTGHRPYPLHDRPYHEIARLICEREPDRPSTAITQHVEVPAPDGTTTRITPELVSATREGDPDKLRRRLSGDIDHILLKALRKEPEQRYTSVERLYDDIQRHLTGLPVLARRGSFTYRTAKFARRRTKELVAAVLVTGAVLGGTVATTWQAQQRRVQARTAQRISAYLTDFLKISDPFLTSDSAEARRKARAARALLDTAAQRVRRELADEPASQASLMDTLGKIYQNLAIYDEARSLIEEALAQRARLHGPGHLDVAASQWSLAELLVEMGDADGAETLLLEALATRRQQLGDSHPDVAQAQQTLARVYTMQADFEAAERTQRAALDILQAQREPDAHAVAWAQHQLGVILERAGRPEDALRLHEAALAQLRALHGDRNPYVADVTRRVAWARFSDPNAPAKQYEPCRQLLIRSLETYRETLGAEHPRVADTYNELAELAIDQQDFAQAEAYARQAIPMLKRVYAVDHPSALNSMNQLAFALKGQYEYDQAQRVYQEVLALRRQSQGSDHPDVAQVLKNLAVLEHARENYAASESYLREALAIRQRALGDAHPKTLDTLNDLAAVQLYTGDFEEAAELYSRALRIVVDTDGQGGRDTAACLARLARVQYLRDDTDEAERLLRRALDIHHETLDKGHRYFAYTLTSLGDVLIAKGQAEQAESILEDALDILRATVPEAHHARTLRALGETRLMLGDLESAERLLEQCLAIQQRTLPPGFVGIGVTKSALGATLLELGRLLEAEQALVDAAQIIEDSVAVNPTMRKRALQRLARLYHALNLPEEAAAVESRLADGSE